jgi:bifunctional ADP-heptose synthase (sugar kinase/adenylyltransferase)
VFQDRSALQFLSRAEPDIWAKGGDYNLDTLDQVERRAVEDTGGRVLLIPMVPGKSTTLLLAATKK